MTVATKQIKPQGPTIIEENRTFNPGENLRREELYFKSITSPAARVWINGPCVVLGRFLRAEDEVHIARAASLGIPILHRPSGGGAVFHDLGNINYSLFLPSYGKALRIEDSLRSLSYPVIRLLDTLGILWEWVPPNNIYVDGKKISGSAQARRGGRLLHHGTLLVDSDLDLMRSLLKPGGRSQIAPVINLSHLSPEMTTEKARAALEIVLRKSVTRS